MFASAASSRQINSREIPGGDLGWLLAVLFLFFCVGGAGALAAQEQPVENQDPVARQGFLVDVELPLVGERDQVIKNQVSRIVDLTRGSKQRATIVLKFYAAPMADLLGDAENGGLGTRGSQFERCLSLASFFTSGDTRSVRLIAYLPESVEGHAVLPVLACEEIFCASEAQLGRAAVDEVTDLNLVKVAYQSVVEKRRTLPAAAVAAMLDPSEEVYNVELLAGGYQVSSKAEAAKLQEEGKVLAPNMIWPGGALATFSGREMRNWRWIAGPATSEADVVEALGLSGNLRTTQQLPREWRSVGVTLAGELSSSRINQIIRGLDQEIQQQDTNLVVFSVQAGDGDFSELTRFANYVVQLRDRDVYTLGLVTDQVLGPMGLIATACQETVLVADGQLGPAAASTKNTDLGPAKQRVLADLAERSDRPVSMLSALVSPEANVREYRHAVTQKRRLFAEWEYEAQPERDQWLLIRDVLTGEPIANDVAITQRLADAEADNTAGALGRIGLESAPNELRMSWLDASIEGVLAQGWLPRLLLTIGFFALMAELGSPGLGVGGFLSALCFVGFFWVEGLNGNVEWLEILLFVGGLVALAVEVFVVPGFGVFGIGGLLMLFVSVVLASQTFIWPTNSVQLGEISVNLFWTACMALGGMFALLFMHKQLERLPMFRWFSVMPDEDPEDLDYRESVTHREHLLHHEGLTTTRLNPSGKAQFGDYVVPVVGTGALIDQGVPVRVVEVRGNLVLVEATEPA